MTYQIPRGDAYGFVELLILGAAAKLHRSEFSGVGASTMNLRSVGVERSNIRSYQ